jgi:hypothetical protein
MTGFSCTESHVCPLMNILHDAPQNDFSSSHLVLILETGLGGCISVSLSEQGTSFMVTL